MLTQGRQSLCFIINFYPFTLVLNTRVGRLLQGNSHFTCRFNCDVTVFKFELQIPHFPRNEPAVRTQDAAMFSDGSDVSDGSCHTLESCDLLSLIRYKLKENILRILPSSSGHSLLNTYLYIFFIILIAVIIITDTDVNENTSNRIVFTTFNITWLSF